MTKKFNIAVGDTLKKLSAKLQKKDTNGATVPFDLTGKTVSFKLVLSKTPYTVVQSSGTVTIVNAAQGQVEYEFSTSDVNTQGVYNAYFIVSSGGATEHIPHDKSLVVNIHPTDGTSIT